jgi:hypothetical protein
MHEALQVIGFVLSALLIAGVVTLAAFVAQRLVLNDITLPPPPKGGLPLDDWAELPQDSVLFLFVPGVGNRTSRFSVLSYTGELPFP